MSASPTQTLVIEPANQYSLNLGASCRELWRYRDLIYFLILRDIKVRYTQSILGIGWAVIQPLFSMVFLTIIFGKFAKIPSDSLPYALFSYAALVPWTYFSSAVADASSSLSSNMNMVTKIYFPKLVLPVAAVLSKLIDFCIALSLIALLMLYYGTRPTWALLYVPLLMVLMVAVASACSITLSALSIQYRDIRYGLGFGLQLFMYITPVTYPITMIPEAYHWIYNLNPVSGIIEGFRCALLGHKAMPFEAIVSATSVTLLLLIVGSWYFKKTERIFADVA